VIDDGARTTSRSKTRGPAPLTVCKLLYMFRSHLQGFFAPDAPRVKIIIAWAIIIVDISGQKVDYVNQKFRMFL
jgi:hypothetical protein